MTGISETTLSPRTDLVTEGYGEGRLRYTLFKQTRELEGVSCDVYGIEIICSLFSDEEKIEICDITPDGTDARELFDLVSSNLVTPVSFQSIVEDFLEEKYGA